MCIYDSYMCRILQIITVCRKNVVISQEVYADWHPKRPPGDWPIQRILQKTSNSVWVRIVVLLHISSSLWYPPSRPSPASQVTKTQRSPTCHCLSMHKTNTEITFVIGASGFAGCSNCRHQSPSWSGEAASLLESEHKRLIWISWLPLDLFNLHTLLPWKLSIKLWNQQINTIINSYKSRRLTAENSVPSTHFWGGRCPPYAAEWRAFVRVKCHIWKNINNQLHKLLPVTWWLKILIEYRALFRGWSFYTCRWGLELSQHKQLTLWFGNERRSMALRLHCHDYRIRLYTWKKNMRSKLHVQQYLVHSDRINISWPPNGKIFSFLLTSPPVHGWGARASIINRCWLATGIGDPHPSTLMSHG